MTRDGPFASVDECLTTLARGSVASDEPHVDVLSHSLQCGAILRHEQPNDLELAVAGLLHDVADAVDPNDHTDHDRRGAALVRALFGPRVAKLVGAHVLAKRYLVTTEPLYRSSLSVRSVETLGLQGEDLDTDQLAELARDPDFDAILTLRRADERAKNPHAAVPGIASWRADLERLAHRRG
jgi:predicted HD phosphohydrolase